MDAEMMPQNIEFSSEVSAVPPRAGIVYDHGQGSVAECVTEDSATVTPDSISKSCQFGVGDTAEGILHADHDTYHHEGDPRVSLGVKQGKESCQFTTFLRQV